ncbi:WD domain G-beta repeat [Carpediemonas membranifera]|uniref:WD domain G-beta repeat n=1 Tax=Carpediemonas membranifera TaxID=201153 RepID=A0A8J6BAR3_9EUKA|nr:WD domain G-beta repeat [Carpediemonas membranifera]|eukprot:KAG9393462.1 WD domain G-beta repeat [Carpediemonas membranifera]
MNDADEDLTLSSNSVDLIKHPIVAHGRIVSSLLALQELSVPPSVFSSVYNSLVEEHGAPNRVLITGETVPLTEEQFNARYSSHPHSVIPSLPPLHQMLPAPQNPAPTRFRAAFTGREIPRAMHMAHALSSYRRIPPSAMALAITPLFTACGHLSPVFCIAFSDDGRLLATGGDDGLVKLWDTRTGMLRRTLKGHFLGNTKTDVISEIAISPGSEYAASCAGTESIALLYPLTPGPRQYAAIPLKAHDGQINLVRFIPPHLCKEPTLITVADDGRVYLWPARGAEAALNAEGPFAPPHEFVYACEAEVCWVEVCPTPPLRIAVVNAAGSVIVTRRGQDGAWASTAVHSFGSDGSLARFTEDGAMLLACSQSAVAAFDVSDPDSNPTQLWVSDLTLLPAIGPLRSRTPVKAQVGNMVLSGRHAVVTAVQETPRGNGRFRLIGMAYLLDLPTGRIRYGWTSTTGDVTPSVTTIGGLVLLGGADGYVRLLDPDSPTVPLKTFPFPSFNSFPGPETQRTSVIVNVACTHAESSPTGLLAALANGEGQILLVGPHAAREILCRAPQEQFFEHDYMPVTVDSAGFSADVNTGLPPHMIRDQMLCSAGLKPYRPGLPYHAQQESTFTEFLPDMRPIISEVDWYLHVADFKRQTLTRTCGDPDICLPTAIIKPALLLQTRPRERPRAPPVQRQEAEREVEDESDTDDYTHQETPVRRIAVRTRRPVRGWSDSDSAESELDLTDSDFAPQRRRRPAPPSPVASPEPDPNRYRVYYIPGCGPAPDMPAWPNIPSKPVVDAADVPRLRTLPASSSRCLNSCAPVDGLYIPCLGDLVVYSPTLHRQYAASLPFMRRGVANDIYPCTLPADFAFPARVVDIASEYHWSFPDNLAGKYCITVQVMELKPILPISVSNIDWLRRWPLWPNLLFEIGVTEIEILEYREYLLRQSSAVTAAAPLIPQAVPAWAARLSALQSCRLRVVTVPEVRSPKIPASPVISAQSLIDSLSRVQRKIGSGMLVTSTVSLKIGFDFVDPDQTAPMETQDDSDIDSDSDSATHLYYGKTERTNRGWLCRAVDYGIQDEDDNYLVNDRFDLHAAAQRLEPPHAGGAVVINDTTLTPLDLAPLTVLTALEFAAEHALPLIPLDLVQVIKFTRSPDADIDSAIILRYAGRVPLTPPPLPTAALFPFHVIQLTVTDFEDVLEARMQASESELDIYEERQTRNKSRKKTRTQRRRKAKKHKAPADAATCFLTAQMPAYKRVFPGNNELGDVFGCDQLKLTVTLTDDLALRLQEANEESYSRAEASIVELPEDMVTSAKTPMAMLPIPDFLRERMALSIAALCKQRATVSPWTSAAALITDPGQIEGYMEEIPDPVHICLILRRLLSGWYTRLGMIDCDLATLAENPVTFSGDEDLAAVARVLQRDILKDLEIIIRTKR